MAQDVSSYFKLGFHQMRCAPQLIIPFLISTALPPAMGWVIIFAFTLISLPVLGEVTPILEKNQHLISEILIEERFIDRTDPQMQAFVEELSTLIPEMIPLFILFLAIFFITIVIYFILAAWVRAGTMGYIWKGVTDSLDFKNFLVYAKQYLFRIIGLWALITVFSIMLFSIPFSILLFIPSPANVIVFVLLMLLLFILWLLVMLLLFFIEESIIIEDKSVIEAIKRSRELVTGNVGLTLLFFVNLIVIFVVYGVTAGAFEFVARMFNSSFLTLFTLFSAVFLSPWIHLAKLNFFLDVTGKTTRALEKEVTIANATKKFVIDSPHILVDFVKKNMVYVLVALSFYGVGIGVGHHIGHSFSFLTDEIMMLVSNKWESGLVLGPYISIPLIDLIYYFSNNSMVGINLGLSGLFLGIPSMTGVAFNGLIIGLFYGLFSTKIATAFLVVHGVFECTALVLATAAGIRLGAGFIKDFANINEILEETIKVLLATLLLIGIAAFLEAFISPIVISNLL